MQQHQHQPGQLLLGFLQALNSYAVQQNCYPVQEQLPCKQHAWLL
jgi:hypothetical protein